MVEEFRICLSFVTYWCFFPPSPLPHCQAHFLTCGRGGGKSHLARRRPKACSGLRKRSTNLRRIRGHFLITLELVSPQKCSLNLMCGSFGAKRSLCTCVYINRVYLCFLTIFYHADFTELFFTIALRHAVTRCYYHHYAINFTEMALTLIDLD